MTDAPSSTVLLSALRQTAHLLALAPDRPQDAVDLRALASQLTKEDRRQAIDAVALIGARGTNRGKALGAALERWLEGA